MGVWVGGGGDLNLLSQTPLKKREKERTTVPKEKKKEEKKREINSQGQGPAQSLSSFLEERKKRRMFAGGSLERQRTRSEIHASGW